MVKVPEKFQGIWSEWIKLSIFLWAKLRLVRFFFNGWKNCISKLPGLFYERGRVFLAKLVFADAGKTKKWHSKQLFPPGLALVVSGLALSKALRLSSPNQQPTASRFLQDGPKVTSYKL